MRMKTTYTFLTINHIWGLFFSCPTVLCTQLVLNKHLTARMRWSLWPWERSTPSAEQQQAGQPWAARLQQACPVPGAPEARGRGWSRARRTWTSHPVNRRFQVAPGPVSTELGPSGKKSRKLISQGVRTTRTRHTGAPKSAQVEQVTLQTTDRPLTDQPAVHILSLTPPPRNCTGTSAACPTSLPSDESSLAGHAPLHLPPSLQTSSSCRPTPKRQCHPAKCSGQILDLSLSFPHTVP